MQSNDYHISMYWYLQQPGKGLELLYYSIGPNQEQEGDIHTGYKANWLNLTDFHPWRWMIQLFISVPAVWTQHFKVTSFT